MTKARITGLNHLTFAVSDLDRSVAFYRDLLGCELRAIWATGAYLEAGSLWLCLSVDGKTRRAPHPDYTHAAFSRGVRGAVGAGAGRRADLEGQP